MRIKRIRAPIIAGLLLLLLVLPQLALADEPGISDPDVPNKTDTTATITWTTNTTSDSGVYYGTTKPPSSHKEDSTPVTHHSISLEGLEPAKVYYFWVESGNLTNDNGGEYWSFETLPGPGGYSITLEPACGVCGDYDPVGKHCGEIIGVTAVVAAEGTYHICWDSLTEAKADFTTSGAGTYTLAFYMPEATKGEHKVYLTDSSYTQKGDYKIFTVNPFVKLVDSETGEKIEEGPVGTKVTLYGYGFKANDAIQINFKDTKITKDTDKANDKGSWTVPYTIPATAGGVYAFDVGPKSDPFVVWLSKYFKVTPKITAPSSGKVGETITVEGKGFASNEADIEVTFDGEVRKENISANKDGSWTAKIIVPIRKCDDYIIDASGETTRARDVDDAEFKVIAGISVEPISAYVGDTITVTGGGFEPEETGIKVSFDGMVVPTTTILPADNYGCWKSSFVLPSSAYGPHTVSASGETTAEVTATLDTLAKITGLSSYKGAPGDSVSLTGNGFHASQKLTVRIDGIAAPGVDGKSLDARTLANGDVNITFRVPKGSTVGTGRTLEVSDESGATNSTAFTVTKKIISTIPLPISPKDSTLRSGEVTFKWQGSTGNTGYTYTLEISETADFTTTINPPYEVEESSYTLTEEEALPKGTYYWRVKIVDDYGNAGDWSDSVNFTVSPIPPWVWVVVGLVVLVGLMVVAYRETKFKVTE